MGSHQCRLCWHTWLCEVKANWFTLSLLFCWVLFFCNIIFIYLVTSTAANSVKMSKPPSKVGVGSKKILSCRPKMVAHSHLHATSNCPLQLTGYLHAFELKYGGDGSLFPSCFNWPSIFLTYERTCEDSGKGKEAAIASLTTWHNWRAHSLLQPYNWRAHSLLQPYNWRAHSLVVTKLVIPLDTKWYNWTIWHTSMHWYNLGSQCPNHQAAIHSWPFQKKI